MTEPIRREPKCALNHDGQRQYLLQSGEGSRPCPACGWVLSAAREPASPEMTVAALQHVVEELTAKIQLLVDHMDLNDMLEDHCFTFPDGDVYKAKDSELPRT